MMIWLVVMSASVQASPEVGPSELPEGYFLVEGDIVVGADFFQRATYKRFDHWTDGIVYFEFDSNVSDSRRTAMREAMDEWMDVSGVVFLPRSGQTNYIHIVHSNGNASQVGMVGGEQFVWITGWDNRFIMSSLDQIGTTTFKSMGRTSSRTTRTTSIWREGPVRSGIMTSTP